MLSISQAVILAQMVRTRIAFSKTNPIYLLAVKAESLLREKLGGRPEHRGNQLRWRMLAEHRRVVSDREKVRRAMTPAIHGPASPGGGRTG